MTIIERIQDNFNKGYFGKSMPIDELPEEYPAWTLKHHNWVGVAVPLPAFSPFSEDFAHMKIEAVKDVVIGETAYDILMIRTIVSHPISSDFPIPLTWQVSKGKTC